MASLSFAMLLPLLLLLLLLLFLLHGRRKTSPPGRLLPSPGGALPLLGHLHLFLNLPHRALRALAARHGPVLLLRLGTTRAVLISSAAAARDALKEKDLAFAGRPRMRAGDMIFYGSSDIAFAPYGDYWRRVRRVSVLHLLSNRRVAALRALREEEVGELLAKVYRQSTTGGTVKVGELLIALTNGIVCRAVLGRKYGADALPGGNLSHFFDELQEAMAAPFVGDFIPWLRWVDRLSGMERRARRTSATLDGFLAKVIDEHRRRIDLIPGDGDERLEHGDFLDTLLEVQRRDIGGGGVPLTDANVKALVLVMFVAATDTTYSAVEWAMAELARHPEEMNKVQQEVRSAVGAGGINAVTEDMIGGDKMPYLKAVIKETLRLRMPVPLLFPREATQDTELLGYRIPAGTRVLFNGWAIAMDPSIWDSPEEFRPSRFVGSAVDYKGNHFEFIPFGSGRRICPGMGFATLIVELALASLLYHFDWELPGGTLDVSEITGVTVRLKSHLELIAKPWLAT